jgi:predicted dithiol-disulfide oxidoreductase (DUF899 family)
MVTATPEIESIEKQIYALKEELAKLRRAQPRLPVSDYVFKNHDGGEVALSDLFGGKDDLIVVHNMGTGCVYCTLWADGLNAMTEHLENRAGFVVNSPDSVDTQKAFKASRNWRFKMISSEGSTFNQDMGFASEEGEPWPGVTTFHREGDGSITKVASAWFGPGDDFCAVWPLLDLLGDGANGWEPRYKYS